MRLKHYDTKSSKEFIDDINIVVISDAHGKFAPYIIPIFKSIRPNMIAICGDLVDEKRPFNHEAYTFLQQCREIAKTFVR